MITIAVCIPTCERPDLLRQAVTSCLRQTLLPSEILIGDDSTGDATEKLVAELQRDSPVPIYYWHHVPRYGQAANINSLYCKVSSSHLMLLHDDDLALPNALADLAACWNRYPNLTAAYGKQYVMLDDGTVCHEQSTEVNRAFHRTLEYEGLNKFHWFPGVVQQFPNDGFIMTTDAARATLWRSHPEVGNGGEFDFNLRLCLNYKNFYFLDKYTASYRCTGISMSKSRDDDAVLQSYRILRQADLPPEAAVVRREKLRAFAAQAIVQTSYFGNRKEAWQIYWSEFYPWSARLTPGGFRRLAHCVLPGGLVRCVRETVIRVRMLKKFASAGI